MSEQLTRITEHQCQNAPAQYSDLKALFLNCTLNRRWHPSPWQLPDAWDAGCKTDFKNPEHKR